MAMKRIGVFVCHCGHNIAGVIDIEKVKKDISEYPNVVHVEDYVFLCSEPGQGLVENRIKELNLDGVVVSNCSPTLHQATFRNSAIRAGLNPFRVEVANIREWVSWPHEKEKEKATNKAVKIIKATIEKLKNNTSLIPITIPLTKNVLVVGGGICGMQTALDVANAGFEVYLVEKSSTIGGRMAQLSETFPTLDCPQCIMTPKMSEINQHSNIHLLAYSEIEEVSGYIGNFNVKIRKKAKSIDETLCTGCKECSIHCLVRYKPQIPEVKSIRKQLKKEELQKLDEIIKRYKNDKGPLLPVLQDVNLEYDYLPKDVLKYVSEILKIPLSRIYQLATFYNAFSLEPRGKHIISCCLGTACHVKGGLRVLEEIERLLDIESGQTTEDGKFTLEGVNCLGTCALAPVIVMDGIYYEKMTANKIKKLLDKIRGENQ